jgi:hypothetical protein
MLFYTKSGIDISTKTGVLVIRSGDALVSKPEAMQFAQYYSDAIVRFFLDWLSVSRSDAIELAVQFLLFSETHRPAKGKYKSLTIKEVARTRFERRTNGGKFRNWLTIKCKEWYLRRHLKIRFKTHRINEISVGHIEERDSENNRNIAVSPQCGESIGPEFLIVWSTIQKSISRKYGRSTGAIFRRIIVDGVCASHCASSLGISPGYTSKLISKSIEALVEEIKLQFLNGPKFPELNIGKILDSCDVVAQAPFTKNKQHLCRLLIHRIANAYQPD